MKHTKRGTTNRNVRGNTKDRAARKAYLMRTYASDVPGKVRCYRCGDLLAEADMTIDRILPGKMGGKYVRSNIRPSCVACAVATSIDVRWRDTAASARGSIWALDFGRLKRELDVLRAQGLL